MAVNKNFVVKNGLEVYTDLLFADSATHSVGVGSTSPNFDLDVRGGIGATDLRVTGFTTLTKDFQVGASGSAFYVSNTNNLVGVGTSVPAFLMDIRSSVSSGQTALYVKGDMRVTGDINLDDLTIDDLTVTGIATYKPDGSGGSPDSWIDIDYTGNTTTGGGTTVGFGSTAYFVDNAKAVFGAGEDLEIRHDGNNSIISHNGAGDFLINTADGEKIYVDTSQIVFRNAASTETLATFAQDGAVDLYYNDTRRFATTHGGVVVAGGSSITGISTVQSTAQNQFNATTGALQVAGGAGIAKNLHVGGGASITGITSIYASSDSYVAMIENPHATGDGLRVRAGDVDGDRPFLVEDKGSVNLFAVYGGGGVDINVGVVTARNTTQSSSSTNGAFQIKGGASVSKNLFVGGGAEVSGVSTFSSAIDANGDLDVDGHTNLDNVSIAGVTTATGNITIENVEPTLFLTDTNNNSDFAVRNNDGTFGIRDTTNGVERFTINSTGTVSIPSTGILDVDGHTELDDVNVSGVTTTVQLKVGTAGQTLVGITTILDEDDMASNSATALVTQQSIKAYVAAQITLEDLDFSGDSGTGAVDLDSQTLAISGTASEIKTVASGQSLTISLPDDVIVGNGFTVTGIGSFYNDVKFAGSSGATGLTWDKSTDDLIFEDDAKAIFGTSSDGLEIYHDGSNSYIDDSGTGNLYLRGSASIELRKAGSTEKMLYAEPDAQVELYWNDSKKLETTGSGVIVTGIATATTFSVGDGSHSTDRISIGDSNDLALYHNASNSFIVDRGTGPLYIRGNTAVRIESYTNDAAGEPMIIANSDSSVDIYYDNVVKFSTSGVGATVYGTGALNIPVGTTAERPTLGNSPVNGDIRYNTTLNSYEGYGNGAWGGLGGGTEIDNTIATTTATGISTFVKTDYRSAYFRLQITQGSAYQVGRYLLIHDGTTATLIEESAIATGSMLGTVTAAVVSSNVIIYINMGSSSSATVTHIIDKITV